MPSHLHFDGEQFAYWSTIVDDYMTFGGTKEEAKAEAQKEWGESFTRYEWEPHVQRAKEFGCSAHPPFRCEEIDPITQDQEEA